MFAVISRCVAHSYIIISIITADDALKADTWLHTEQEGDDVIELQNIPSMLFTMQTILRFSDFTWVKANIRGVRLRASSWRYGEARMLPPRPEVPTSRSCEVTLATAPNYKCTGFTRLLTPVLMRQHSPSHPRTIHVIGDMFLIAHLRRQRRVRHIQVMMQEYKPVYKNGDDTIQ